MRVPSAAWASRSSRVPRPVARRGRGLPGCAARRPRARRYANASASVVTRAEDRSGASSSASIWRGAGVMIGGSAPWRVQRGVVGMIGCCGQVGRKWENIRRGPVGDAGEVARSRRARGCCRRVGAYATAHALDVGGGVGRSTVSRSQRRAKPAQGPGDWPPRAVAPSRGLLEGSSSLRGGTRDGADSIRPSISHPLAERPLLPLRLTVYLTVVTIYRRSIPVQAGWSGKGLGMGIEW